MKRIQSIAAFTRMFLKSNNANVLTSRHGFFVSPFRQAKGVLVFVLSVLLTTSGVLFAQQASSGLTALASQEVPVENGESGSIFNSQAVGGADIFEFQNFQPRVAEFELIDPEYDRQYYQKLVDLVVRVRQELTSTTAFMSFLKDSIDRRSTRLGRDYYKAFDTIFANYYRYISPAVRGQFYLERAENLLEQAEVALRERETIFPLVINEEDLKKTVYELKLLSALVNILRGNTAQLRKATVDLEFLLGNNAQSLSYVSSQEDATKLYYYLAGVYNELYNINSDDYVGSRPFLQRKLFYLWTLVSDANESNTALRDVKLQKLYDTYVSIMDPNSAEYENLYKPYRKVALERYNDIQTQVGIVDTNESVSTPSDAPVNLETDTPVTPTQ